MIEKRLTKNWFKKAIFGCLFAMIGVFGVSVMAPATDVYADPVVSTETVKTENTGGQVNGLSCKESLAPIGWLVCPTTGKISEAVDWLYKKIEDVLVIHPVEMKDGSPIYEIWKYARGITNIVFIILFLVVIYSQLTGIGITNYGIKKILPKMIVVAILVNLSFIICSLAVDVSNIVGNSLRGIFTSIEESTMATMEMPSVSSVSMSEMYSSLAGGTALAVGAGVIAFETGSIWMLIPTVLGAIVAVASGLITIALRQAVVALLIMISPLAIVAYMLPNTEDLFKRWKKLLTQMLVFYPMFSLLFGASNLAGWAIITSAKDGFGLMLGVAVQIFPLFFSWNLMKMSGTFLSTINGKIQSMAARPLAVNRAWADSRRAQTRAYNIQYGKTPSARLQRYLDNRRTLREKNISSLEKIRQNEANIYVQRKIGANYDGSKAQGTGEYLRPNRYTRIAKDLANSNLASETATMDTTHAINEYAEYYVSKSTRDKVQAARRTKNNRILEQIEAEDAEYRRSATGGRNYLEYSRAQMTEENDREADFNFMVSEFLGAFRGYDPNDPRDKFSKYRHYIASSAGGLGETGQTRVLGKIIARAAAVESSQRRDINIIANKFPHDKAKFRSMFVGYRVNDDGFAVDENGNEIEKIRGYLLENDPDKLVLWDKVDEHGRKYYDWYDGDQFVTRIYETDSSAFKELLSNFDAPINDPINNLYGILAGIKKGDIQGEKEGLKRIGLERYRTTIGRALLSAPFKEKNAAFSPMVAEMIKKGYIKNYAQECLAYLDSLNKATKPGAFNVQDADAIKMLATIMDPSNWDEIFPTELISESKNVNGEPIYGIRYNEAGEVVKVPAEEATREELMERVKQKYIIPAARKITMMMSRQTPNTADNQKAGTVEEWKKLKDVFDTKWGRGHMFEIDPYEQRGDMRRIARDVRESLHTVDSKSSSTTPVSSAIFENEVEEIFINSGNDAERFSQDFMEYCYERRPHLDMVLQEFLRIKDETESSGKFMSCDELLEEIKSLFMQFYTD